MEELNLSKIVEKMNILTETNMLIPLAFVAFIFMFFCYKASLLIKVNIMKKSVENTLKGFASILRTQEDVKSSEKSLISYVRNKFHDEFKNIDSFFKEKKYISHTWNEFKEQIFEININDESLYANSFRPSDFFTREALFLESKINEHRIEGTSQKLIALGIIGTFIGLTIGIYGLSQNFNVQSGNAKLIGEGISQLLAGAWTAFISSFVGIFFSIVFSLWREFSFNSLDTVLHQLNSELEKSLRLLTQEELSYKNLIVCSKQNKLLAKQAEVLANIDENINLKLDEAPNKIANQIAPILAKLENVTQDVKEAVLNFRNSGEGAIQNQFEGASLKVEELIKMLSSVMEEASKKQAEFQNIFKAVIIELGSKSKEMSDQIDSKLIKMIEKTDDSNSKFKNDMKEIQMQSQNENVKVFNSLKDVAHSLEKSTDQIKDLSDSLQSKADKEKKTLDQLMSISAQTQGGIQQLSSLSESLSSVGSSLESFSSKMESQTSNLTNINQNTERFFNDYISQTRSILGVIDEQVKKLLEDLDEKFLKEMVKGLLSTTEQMHKNFSEIQRGVGDVCAHFTGAVETLRESIDDFSDLKEISDESRENLG